MNSQPPTARQHYRAAIVAMMVMAAALIVHEIFGQNGYLELRKQKQEYQALEQQIEQLRQENQGLEKQVKALRSDPKAIEKIARDAPQGAEPQAPVAEQREPFWAGE